jgi:hypothetical protein
MNLNRSGTLKPETCESKGTKPDPGSALMESITPYPWHRDYKGDLYGANGRPIFFQGIDAIVVQHAPLMLKTLLAIQQLATSDSENGALLRKIWGLAAAMIADVERGGEESRWCRGSIE